MPRQHSRPLPRRRASVQLSYEGCLEFPQFVGDLLAQAPESQQRGRSRTRHAHSPPPRSPSGEAQAAIRRVLNYFWVCQEMGFRIATMETVAVDHGDLSEVQVGILAGLVEVFYQRLVVQRDTSTRDMRRAFRNRMAPLIGEFGLHADSIFSRLQDLRMRAYGRRRSEGVGRETILGFSDSASLLHAFFFLYAHAHIAGISSSRQQIIPRIDTSPADLSTTIHSYPRRYIKMALNLLSQLLPYQRACRQLGATRHALNYEGTRPSYYPTPALVRGIRRCGMCVPEILWYLDGKWNEGQAARRRKREDLKHLISKLWRSCMSEPADMTEALVSRWSDQYQARALLACIEAVQRDGPDHMPAFQVVIRTTTLRPWMTMEELRAQLESEWHRSPTLVREHEERIRETQRVINTRYSQYVAGLLDEASDGDDEEIFE
ncbi:uncharacterized protein MYCFIDRAFT_82422 [Pseudocercospora fijiensis CIRAD86]|uniref:Uncharacterized protein n=1 Tax=Pseudocercospora fijiensis (strain CIRAD86) TaxID=383855 RepID=M3AZB3_PSEFD|nr:uncharacterized protein MYCFIDRAFT_82422 [Pseudocercospora fijiensis CIRAD86]EME82518.1 hypothetical protein MYCFIDRAFT_82422 [Pseudocercospora fijiensis CIRAD86]